MTRRRTYDINTLGYNDLRRIYPPDRGRLRARYGAQHESCQGAHRHRLDMEERYASACQRLAEISGLAGRRRNQYLERGQPLTGSKGALRFFDQRRAVWITEFNRCSGQCYE